MNYGEFAGCFECVNWRRNNYAEQQRGRCELIGTVTLRLEWCKRFEAISLLQASAPGETASVAGET